MASLMHALPEGSYAGAGYLLTSLNSTSDTSDYSRWLDLDAAVARASWNAGKHSLTRYAAFVLDEPSIPTDRDVYVHH